jgi:hypothetical protein
MSTQLEKASQPQIEFRIRPGFHLLMAYACSVVLLASLVGVWTKPYSLTESLSLP